MSTPHTATITIEVNYFPATDRLPARIQSIGLVGGTMHRFKPDEIISRPLARDLVNEAASQSREHEP